MELGSWKQVLDRHGPTVAYAALRQGTLPYIPHTLLKTGHGVKWPESHEFILTRRWWKETWRTEITYRGTAEADTAKEERDIRKWLKEKGELRESHDSESWEEMHGRLRTGSPAGEDVNPAAAPAPAHCPPQTDTERAVNPAHYGPEYDEIHDSVIKKRPKSVAGVAGSQRQIRCSRRDGRRSR